jgi:Cu+-exporting ATPase
VRAGGRVVSGTLRLAVERAVSHSRLAGLWNNPVFATAKPYWLTDLSSRTSAWFTLAAIVLAAGGAVAWWPDARRSAEVATAVLIVACPCALTLSAPITLGTAMSMLGRRGFYLKHPAVALDMSRVTTIAFDKTGTLTAAGSHLRAVPDQLSASDWHLARRLAAESLHPASRAIAAGALPQGRLDAFTETPGRGLRGVVDGHDVVIGTPPFVGGAVGAPADDDDGSIRVAIDGAVGGRIWVSAPAREGVEAAAATLGAAHDVLLLSGDHSHEAARWRPIFGEHMSFRQSPEDKLAIVRARQAAGARVLMVGDGLNDAGALGAADVGIAVSDESACVVPACDAVIRGDRLADLPAFLAYTRRARLVIVAAVLISLAYNVVGVSFALLGLMTPLVTAILMPVSSLTVVGLAVGAMRWSAPGERTP